MIAFVEVEFSKLGSFCIFVFESQAVAGAAMGIDRCVRVNMLPSTFLWMELSGIFRIGDFIAWGKVPGNSLSDPYGS